MRRATRWLAGALCAWALTAAWAAAQPLTVATYNLENYTITDRMAEEIFRKEYPKPEAEKAAVRAVIRQINADVLAVQEIGGEAFVRELVRDLKTEGVEYAHSAVLRGEDAARCVAVLSKRPFTAVTRHTDLSFKFFDGMETVKRGLLEVRVGHEGGEVTVFVAHLKSRYTERADDPQAAVQRAGEATAIRDRVLKVFPRPAEARFMLVGDFNDGRTSRTLRALMKRGETVIAEWLPAADSRGEVWTHFYRKDDSYSRVDHVLVSSELRARVRRGVGTIWDSPEVGQASDHRPVVVVID